MIEATRRWLRRNRTRLAVGAGLVGAGYLAVQYVSHRIAETRERMAADRLAKENLRRRFAQNQEDCTFTVLALLPTAANPILESLPVESITAELQQQRADRRGRSSGASDASPSEISSIVSGDDGQSTTSAQTGSYVHATAAAASDANSSENTRRTKAELWRDLKINAITRTLTLMYLLALLTIFTRLQLNLLGRRSYLFSVVEMAAPTVTGGDKPITLENDDDTPAITRSPGDDLEINRRYLAFSWWLLHRGWRDLQTRIQQAVAEVFGLLNPRDEISFQDLAELILEVRKRIEGATELERRTRNWLPYVLPPDDQELFVLRESGVLPAVALDPVDPDAHAPADSSETASLRTSAIPPTLQRLLDETADIVESDRFTRVLTRLLDTLFTHLTESSLRTQAFKLPPLPALAANSHPLSSPAAGIGAGLLGSAASSAPAQSINDPSSNPQVSQPNAPSVTSTGSATSAASAPVDFSTVHAKLASVLAVMARQAHTFAAIPQAAVTALDAVPELDALAVLVYTHHFDVEGIRDAQIQAQAAGLSVGTGDLRDFDATLEDSRPADVQTGRGWLGATWGLVGSAWSMVAG